MLFARTTSSTSISPPAMMMQQHQQQTQQQQQQQDPQQLGQQFHQQPAFQLQQSFCESVCSGIEVEIENNNNNHIHHGDSTYHMKILVPAVASGAIIGKGGETIASLQKDTGARVKMSKSHDFYPGTTERVCLITGSTEAIMVVMEFIMDKIREKPDLTNKIVDVESKQTQERDKQVKILVPNSTAGMIIGKGGAFIKQIKEESGSYVQISQKPKDVSLQERCITIIGDKENNKNACKMILSKIVEDPQSGTCLNVSYGPNGRSLVEIQHVSGANVQISKKGIFAPGTRNRIVTITGQPSAIAKAQYLIEQKINEEETKRARQIPLTTVVN
ncbi:GD18616 [Drosophila simulans]|uniref:GD18616 n=1 Tax=Drosophila simulans TaxID=7240 RepID=B4QWM4_DROSI|nr:GD18616 [Drosophila simulans]